MILNRPFNKIVFVFCAFICSQFIPQFSLAQTTLAPGDLFFTGYNSVPTTSQDHFSFVLLRNITSGTVIKFTDRGWFIDPGPVEGFVTGGTQDGVISWTATSNVSCGTEITVNCEGNTTLSASNGTVAGLISQASPALDPPNTSNFIEFNTAGDQLFAYQGSEAAPTMLQGLDMNGGFIATLSSSVSSTGSALPSVLGATHAIALTPETDNGKYNSPTAPFVATQASLYSSLKTPGNWILQNSTYYALPTGSAWNVTDCIIFDLVPELELSHSTKGPMLSWAMSDQISSYSVERSGKNVGWEILATFTQNASGTNYNWMDEAPLQEKSWYRILSTDISGESKYSNIVEYNSPVADAIILFPAISDGNITLYCKEGFQGNTQITIYNREGKRMGTKLINEGTECKLDFSSLENGFYFYSISSKNRKSNGKLMILHGVVARIGHHQR
jgi:Secretion system C-terminal sorting domain